MKIAFGLYAFCALVACGGANPPASSLPPESACPAPTDPCMNEDNHAECLRVEAQCPGAVLHLESCPLQFACE